MSHYEERLQKDLDRLHRYVKELGNTVENALQNATRAIMTSNSELAADTVIGDLEVNRMSRRIDKQCHKFVARHLPSAGTLRYISSVLRLSIGLERIGDYAETIARTALQLSEGPPSAVSRDIEMMSDQSARVLHQALKGFNEGSADIARGILGVSGQYSSTFDRVFADLIREGEENSRPMSDLFALLSTFNRLERIVHQAKNICEETIFAATGELKKPKTFNILFVDEHNDGTSQLAAHFASKAYPDGGTYQSAGTDPASSMNESFVAFASEQELNLASASPRPFSQVEDLLDEFQFVIWLGADDGSDLPTMPFHTVLMRWPIDTTSPDSAYKDLSSRFGDLMDRLHGEDAD